MTTILKCRAAVLEKIGGPLVIRDLDMPKLHENQVLIKVMFSGVCRSQVMEVDGGRGSDHWLPHLLGHEGSGIVLNVGLNVKKVKKGDEVILGWVQGEGADAPGAIYTIDNQIVNSGKVTTFSNYTIASESRVYKKPNGLDLDAAVLYGCALPTGAGMILNQAKPSKESSVAIIGLGGVGYSALMAAKSLGVRNLIAIDISEEKLYVANKLGARHTFSASDSELPKKIFEITNGGVDICIESAGSIGTIEMGFSIIRHWGGRLYFASHPPDGEVIKLSPHDLIKGKQIIGSWGGGSSPDQDIKKIFKKFQLAKIDHSYLIAKRYSLEQINEAIDDLRQGKAFRPIIQMRH